MAREKTDYREALAVLRELHPGRLSLSIAESAKAPGVCTKTLTRAIDCGALPAQNIGKGKVNKTYIIALPALARWSIGG